MAGPVDERMTVVLSGALSRGLATCGRTGSRGSCGER
jgi:hypothetical protein